MRALLSGLLFLTGLLVPGLGPLARADERALERLDPRATLAQARSLAAPVPVPAPPAAPTPQRAAPAPPPGGPTARLHPTAPAPWMRPPGWYYGPGWYRGRYYVSPWAYSVYLGAPFWWGWGWGYGWYPFYPAPPPLSPGEVAPARRLNAEIVLSAGPTRQRAFGDPTRKIGPGVSAGVALAFEGERLGVQLGYDGFFIDGDMAFGGTAGLEHGTALVTYSILAGPNGRLRLEGGLSTTTWPSRLPYSGTTAVGPDVGVSGRLGLVGPLGIQGYARITPSPRQAVDASLAAALRLGPAALTAGWRDFRIEGGSSEPDLRFAGPQFGLAFLF